MAPPAIDTSIHPLQGPHAPPAYHSQPQSTAPRMQTKTLRWTFWLTFLSLLATFIMSVIMLAAGTRTSDDGNGKAGHTSIFLEKFKILNIPIKYPFLCNESEPPCQAHWTVKMFLNGVWAEHDFPGDYLHSHLLWKGAGKTFNLTTALTIMDNTLQLKGPASQDSNYTIPTDPTRYVREMSPVQTKKPFILFVLAIIPMWPLFLLWFMEGFLSTPQRRRRLVQRRWILLIMGVSFTFYVAGAAYLSSAAGKAANQLAGNWEYIATPQGTAYMGSKFQALEGGICFMQLFATSMYAVHAYFERGLLPKNQAEERESVELMQRVDDVRPQNGRHSTESQPPPYTPEPTLLERIRMTESASRARLENGGIREARSEV